MSTLLTDTFRKIFRIERKSQERHAVYLTPTWQVLGTQGVRPLPDLIRLSYHFYDTEILLRTIISVLQREVFRNGIAVINKNGQFVNVKESVFAQLLAKANDTQTLEEVLRDAYVDLNVTGNAFIIIELDADRTTIKQVYKANPDFCELVLSADGKAGMTDNGLLMFCVLHREVHRTVKLSGNEEYDYELLTETRCNKCGNVMLPAFLRFYHPFYGYLHYSADEVIHLKKWSREIGMGIPPIACMLEKLYLMQAHDYFLATTYSLQRPPNTLVILRGGNVRSLESAIQKAFTEAQQNPNLLPIISVDADIAEKLVETINLAPQIKEAELKQLRDEIRSQLAALYGVMPIFTGDLRGVGGLNQEGLQIMVTNRTVEDEQKILNKALERISRLVDRSGEYTLVMNKNELRDEASIQEYNSKVLANIQTLQSLGYEVEISMNEEGKISYSITGRRENVQAKKGLTGMSPALTSPELTPPRTTEPAETEGRTVQAGMEGSVERMGSAQMTREMT